MRLTVLGSAGSMPGSDSPSSAYLVQAEGYTLLLDLGFGALGALRRAGVLFDLDAVVVSHLHPDHCADLAALLVARRYYAPTRELPLLAVHGPAGTADRIAQIAGPGLGDQVRDTFDVYSLLPGALELGPFSVTLARMNHPVETFGSRIEAGGKILAYSADTGECDELVELAGDADLFLCEATYRDDPENPPNLHLSGRQAGEYAARAEAKRLLLTHTVAEIGDPLDLVAEAKGAYDGPIELARPTWVYDA